MVLGLENLRIIIPNIDYEKLIKMDPTRNSCGRRYSLTLNKSVSDDEITQTPNTEFYNNLKKKMFKKYIQKTHITSEYGLIVPRKSDNKL